jgi:hypothetical protein
MYFIGELASFVFVVVVIGGGGGSFFLTQILVMLQI